MTYPDPPTIHPCSVRDVITAHKLPPVKRDVNNGTDRAIIISQSVITRRYAVENKLCGNMPPPRLLYAARCGPHPIYSLHALRLQCGAQCALLPIAVGAMSINELMNINE